MRKNYVGLRKSLRPLYPKSGGSQSTVPTKGQRALDQIAAENAKAAQPLFQEALGSAYDPAHAPKYFEGDTVAQFDPITQQAQQMQVAQANNLTDNVNPAIQQAMEFGLNGVRGPNPFLEDYMRVATDPMLAQFQNDILPKIGSASEQAGAYGGVRQGLAEATAAKDLERQVGDMRTKMSFDGYNKGLDVFQNVLGMSPQLIQSMNMPAQLMGDVGEQIMKQEQKNIDASVDRFNFEQDPDFQRYQKYLPILQGLNGGQVSNTPAGQKSSSGGDFLSSIMGK